ncbi:MAG: MarR family winged helix-turn-helix transcriptional regulator, partial [Steroidobacteraceae bacterium]
FLVVVLRVRRNAPVPAPQSSHFHCGSNAVHQVSDFDFPGSYTLPQVLLISRVEQLRSASLSDLSEGLKVSGPAVSQMIERLVKQGLLRRSEDPADRRRKAIVVTPRARTLLRKLEATRSADYERGLASVSPELRTQLVALLTQIIGAIERAQALDRTGRPPPA